jgi:hypothetical protein
MPDMIPLIINEDAANEIEGTSIEAATMFRLMPSVNAQHKRYLQASASRTSFILKADTCIKLIVNGAHYVCGVQADKVISIADALDTDVSVAGGKDVYIYACLDDFDPLNIGLKIIVSLNSTYPDGYDEATSRKIGGFHTLCADVGTISGHPLSGFEAGDILPTSIWCLTHRPETSGPEGMAYIEPLGLWVDIYLMSGTGTMSRSVYGATITDTRNYLDFTDDLAAVGKTLLHDEEFQVAAAGSNEQTNIAGSADPNTTGGHTDTAGRRMISSYGLEDCCGAMWQFLTGGGWRFVTPTFNSADYPAPSGPNDGGSSTDANRHDDWPGEKGSTWSTDGRCALIGGAYWGNGTSCGSRARTAAHSRSDTHASIGARGRARSLPCV